MSAEPITPRAVTRTSRRVDLASRLDGTYNPPLPEIGACRDDGQLLLYPGRWSSCIALTGAGKTFFALLHTKGILDRGGVVGYLHFEEIQPDGMINRLLNMGCTKRQIAEQFAWLDCSQRWTAPDFTWELDELPIAPALLVIDGTNAMCSLHGWSPFEPVSTGLFRNTFAYPAQKRGAAVLTLGHPPKSPDRQNERHGYGGTAWLDEVDGVAFRLEVSKSKPIARGERGYSQLWSVKDRYGSVEKTGVRHTRDSGAWYDLGTLTVDDRYEGTNVSIAPPGASAGSTAPDAVDLLVPKVFKVIGEHDGRYDSQRQLGTWLRAVGIGFNDRDLGVALERMEQRGMLRRPPAENRKSRPGWLPATGVQDRHHTSDLDLAIAAAVTAVPLKGAHSSTAVQQDCGEVIVTAVHSSPQQAAAIEIVQQVLGPVEEINYEETEG